MGAVATPDDRLLAALAPFADDYELWARTFFRIRDKHGKIRPLTLTPAQRMVGEAEREELAKHGEARIYVLKGRQGGVTTDQQARSLHSVMLANPGFDALTLAHTGEDTEKIFSITKRAIEEWPDEFQFVIPERSPKEASELHFTRLDTRFFTGTAGSKRTGRGLTILRFHGSEYAFWDDPDAVMGAVEPALVPQGSVVVLETTASGVGGPAHESWLMAGRGETAYRQVFIPWWQCDPENYRLPLLEPDELGPLADDEALLVKRHGLTLEQIKWRRQQIRKMQGSKSRFLQEYAEDPESCWATQGGTFYEVETLNALAARLDEPIRTEMNGQLRIYAEKLEPHERAIIGADTSAGGAGDRQTFSARAMPVGTATHPNTWRKLATFGSKDLTPEGLAGVLNEWGRKYSHPKLGPALLVVERNGHGVTTLRKLRDEHDYPLWRLYHARREADATPTQQAQLGWVTSGTTKPLLLDAGRDLMSAALEGEADVPDAWVIEDARSVVWKDGKVDLNGRDVLVADQLAWMGRSYGLYTPGSMNPNDFKTVRR